MSVIANILISHWIADFILQTDKMAKNKSTSWTWLSRHIAAYTVSFAVIFCLLDLGEHSVYKIIPWVVLNGLAHFATDAVTSRMTSYLWKKQDVHNFFVVIGLDQTIHYLTLFYSFSWLVG